MRKHTTVHDLDSQSYCISGEKRQISLAEGDMILDDDYGKISSCQFFIHYFEYLPQIEIGNSVDCEQSLPWLLKHYDCKIIDCYYKKSFDSEKGCMTYEVVYLLTSDRLMIVVNLNRDTIYCYHQNHSQQDINQLWRNLQQFQLEEKLDDAKISFLIRNRSGLDTQRMEVNKAEIDICLN